ncbi:uncharacterized protein LOC101450236 [Ceratitis capitata]|uniref:(Mediterranean fruit fly) hypothetical protein n=2 Tax=Ceratitis capitata TaxID=7213 RepID=A0A811V1A4_CERCA|nr:uncharacterized protein LOC101450236 [Ceratitis capitata]XP_004527007.1 uncharacterized protein LOC101450236 [Ceratitis capitata]CAD7004724.1 unnamed protein product [Ceratitis capitata]
MDPNNMLFRLEDLTPERLYEEYGISKEDVQRNPALYKAYVDDFIPTREDLECKLDEEQLKELCLRRSCRVLMYRWNPVQDFVDQFTRQGRIQRWTKEKTKKLIIKGICRHKDVCMYSEEEIRIERERQWCERKKENLMRLVLWEYDRVEEQINNEESSQGELELCSAMENEEHIDALMAELLKSPSRSTPSDIASITEQTPHSGALFTSSDTDTIKQQPASDILIPPLAESQPYSIPSTQNTEELAAREYAELMQQAGVNVNPILADYLNVNTDSIQFDDSAILDSEVNCDGTPPYCDFNDHISFTSTQSAGAKRTSPA